MGGCRCTYRNCTVKSDGETHMFHYPVFDKLRCHQWLTNAKRLDFLNLKVSQLKNRVVCQHHFRDEYFMNFKKDKLTFEAVPTELGPYCDDNNPLDNVVTDEGSHVFPIMVEDIEKDQLTFIEKKANFSVKYSDFLTNCEIINPVLVDSNTPVISDHNLIEENEVLSNQYCNVNSNSRVSLPVEDNKKNQMQPMLIVPPFTNHNNISLNPQTLDGIMYELEIEKEPIYTPQDISVKLLDEMSVVSNNQEHQKKKNKVTIISEKKIFDPLPIKGKLEPILPSTIICASNRKKRVETNMLEKENIKNFIEMNPVIISPVENMTQNVDAASTEIKMEQNETPSSLNKKSSTSPNNVVLKNKVPPKRVAEIEEKRVFNKKLRDMIEFCLDELEEEKVTSNKNKITQRKNLNIEEKLNLTQNDKDSKNSNKKNEMIQIGFYNENRNSKDINKLSNLENSELHNYKKLEKQINLTNPKRSTIKKKEIQKDVVCPQMKNTDTNDCSKSEPNLPICNEYIASFFENRFKKMEETLLKKIDQNSQCIADLQNSLKSPVVRKRSISVQTTQSEESYKKYLFHEISKYLSANANNLIYEEMFLNCYLDNPSNSSSSYSVASHSTHVPKRRRNRR